MATVALILVAAGGELWMQRVNPITRAAVSVADEVVLEATEKGIQMRDGASVMNELQNNNREGGEVVYGVNSRGIGASYVDRETGMVTENNIYYGQ